MNKDTLRDILFEYLDRLEIDVGDCPVDEITEEFLQDLDYNGVIDGDWSGDE